MEKNGIEMAVPNKHKVKWIAEVESIMVSCIFSAPEEEHPGIVEHGGILSFSTGGANGGVFT